MIVCNSNNFAVTRAQKTGGASLEIYFLESGLIDSDKDVYTLEGGFSTWQEFKEYSDANNNLKYSELPTNLHGYDSLKEAQKTYTQVVEEGLAPADMPWVGTIRHPVDWLASLYYYANIRRKAIAAKNLKKYGNYSEIDQWKDIRISEPDASWDFIFIEIPEHQAVIDSCKSQMSYYPDHAQLFNFENINKHATAFIEAKGGTVKSNLNIRESDHDNTYYFNNLSADRQQKTLDMFAKDFAAWEKAYAVYN